MWHTVKKTAYVQTEFLVHGKSGYIIFQVYGFNKTRGFKMGDDSGELSLSSWNVIFLLCSYESFFAWCRENDLIPYLQGRGRKKYGRTREEHCSIDTHTQKLPKKGITMSTLVGKKFFQILSGHSDFQSPPLKNST